MINFETKMGTMLLLAHWDSGSERFTMNWLTIWRSLIVHSSSVKPPKCSARMTKSRRIALATGRELP